MYREWTILQIIICNRILKKKTERVQKKKEKVD